MAFAIGAFSLYAGLGGYFESLVQRPVFVALTLVLAILEFRPKTQNPTRRAMATAFDAVAIAVAIAGCAYVAATQDVILGSLPTASSWDIVVTFVLIGVILELCRRSCDSIVFPALVLAAIAYVFLSHLIPGKLGTRGFDAAFFTESMLLSDLGLWGSLTGVAATTVAIFILFGSMLLFTGAGDAFIEVAARASAHTIGGPPKVAVISSSLFGMISGSSVANVATTGSITIPLMKRLNYRPEYAASVEALASTGGQLAPPIMGAAAFVMAQILGVSYWTVAAAACLPALLYYYTIFLNVHRIAAKERPAVDDIAELTRSPDPLWRRLIPTLSAFGTLVVMMVLGRSVEYAVSLGIVALLLTFAIDRLLAGMPLGVVMGKIRDGMIDGGRSLVLTAVLLFGAQIFVSIFNITGLGVGLANLLLNLFGGNLVVLALLSAVICLVAGMGLPTTAAYIITAAVMAPALIEAGLAALTAHMFIFYYAILSAITPPVCVAVFMAAGIAQIPWGNVARETVRLGLVVYTIPALFLVYPGLLLIGGASEIAEGVVSAFVYATCVAFLLTRRTLFGSLPLGTAVWAAAVVGTLVPIWSVTLATVAGLVGVLVVERVLGRRTAPQAGG